VELSWYAPVFLEHFMLIPLLHVVISSTYTSHSLFSRNYCSEDILPRSLLASELETTTQFFRFIVHCIVLHSFHLSLVRISSPHCFYDRKLFLTHTSELDIANFAFFPRAFSFLPLPVTSLRIPCSLFSPSAALKIFFLRLSLYI